MIHLICMLYVSLASPVGQNAKPGFLNWYSSYNLPGHLGAAGKYRFSGIHRTSDKMPFSG